MRYKFNTETHGECLRLKTEAVFKAFGMALKAIIQSIQEQKFSQTKQISVQIEATQKTLTLDVYEWLSGINRIREAA